MILCHLTVLFYVIGFHSNCSGDLHLLVILIFKHNTPDAVLWFKATVPVGVDSVASQLFLIPWQPADWPQEVIWRGFLDSSLCVLSILLQWVICSNSLTWIDPRWGESVQFDPAFVVFESYDAHLTLWPNTTHSWDPLDMPGWDAFIKEKKVFEYTK